MSGSHSVGKLERGFTLIEMMVALLLGLLVIGAALMVFRTNQTTYKANEGQNRIQENVRTAYELMSRDIRSAGGSACSMASEIETTGSYSDVFRDTPVTGSASEMTLTSGDDTAFRTTAATSTSVTFDSAQLADARDQFHSGDWILMCNQRKTFLVQATGVTASTMSFAALPWNYDLDADALAGPPSVAITRLRNVRWYVASNGRGGNSLYVSRFGQGGEEVAEGVSNLAMQYLDSDSGPYKNTEINWPSVKAVRISMTLRGQDVDGRTFTRDFSNVVSVRGRAL